MKRRTKTQIMADVRKANKKKILTVRLANGVEVLKNHILTAVMTGGDKVTNRY
jgi:hypothetical protein